MANRAYLVGSSHPQTAGPGEKGINYAPNTEILAGGSYRIPILWLSLFDESHLTNHTVQEFDIPTVLAKATDSKNLIAQRRSAVLDTFVGCEQYWAEWERLIVESPFEYLKIDATEIWELEEDEAKFRNRFRSALRWFASGEPQDLAQLLELAGVALVKRPKSSNDATYKTTSYIVPTRMIAAGPPPNPSRGHVLYGYS